jgi:hypothetical protein
MSNKTTKMIEADYLDFDFSVYFKKLEKRKLWLFVNPKTGQEFEFVINERALQNRHECVFNGLLDVLLRTNNFDWYYDLMYKYCNNLKETEIGNREYDISFFKNNMDKFYEIANEYISLRDIDFNKFAVKKKKKNSIFFDRDDIEEIYRLSILFKLFFFGHATNHKLKKEGIKEIMAKFTKIGIERDIFAKINNIIEIRMLKYRLTDGEQINRVARSTSTPFEVYSLYIFNLITNYIIIGYDLTNNPINYFLGEINKSLDWFLRTVYTKTIIYYDNIEKKMSDIEEPIGELDNEFSSNIEFSSVDFIKNTYYRDITNKMIFYIHTWLEKKNNKFDMNIVEFVKNKIGYVNKNWICQEMLFPFLEKITNVKSNYFSHLFIEDQYLLQIFIAVLLNKTDIINNTFINFLFYGNLNYFKVNNTFKSKDMDIFKTDKLDMKINKIILYKYISNMNKFISYDFVYLIGNKNKTFKTDKTLLNSMIQFMIKLLNDDFEWDKLKSLFFDMISEIEYDDVNKNTIIFEMSSLYNNNTYDKEMEKFYI